jgi:hypothetical protein
MLKSSPYVVADKILPFFFSVVQPPFTEHVDFLTKPVPLDSSSIRRTISAVRRNQKKKNAEKDLIRSNRDFVLRLNRRAFLCSSTKNLETPTNKPAVDGTLHWRG